MAANSQKPKICIITTIDTSLDMMFPDFFPLLLSKGYEIVGICADGPRVEYVRRQGVRVIIVPMKRDIAPIADIRCLWMLYRIFKREKFDMVHYSTFKASVLVAIAGRLAGCPALLYTLRGFHRFTGAKRLLIKFCDKLAAWSADYIIAISKSLRDEAIEEGISPANRIVVFGAGSSKGVDLQKFQLNERVKSDAVRIRKSMGAKDDDIFVGYAGRLTPNKGIAELLEAFDNIRKDNNNVRLILVGDQDQIRPLPDRMFERIKSDTNIHAIPFTEDIVGYMAATDIFVLPTYRDGFGNVLIEAAALGKPVIGTDIPGARDALQDGINGILVQARDVVSLEKALKEMIANPAKRIEMGIKGKQWVTENFDRNVVWSRLLEVYEKLLTEKRR